MHFVSEPPSIPEMNLRMNALMSKFNQITNESEKFYKELRESSETNNLMNR